MSFVQYSADCDFPIQNLPYGVFTSAGNVSLNQLGGLSAALPLSLCVKDRRRIGVAIGDMVLDLSVVAPVFFTGPELSKNPQVHTSPAQPLV